MDALYTAGTRRCHLQIPSELGFEKVARELAWTVAQGVGLPQGRCDDFRTAVAEATLNAIEHGNHNNPDKQVALIFEIADNRIAATISDAGRSAWQPLPCPLIADKVAGAARARNMGLMLMQALVDEFSLEQPQTGSGTSVRLVMHV